MWLHYLPALAGTRPPTWAAQHFPALPPPSLLGHLHPNPTEHSNFGQNTAVTGKLMMQLYAVMRKEAEMSLTEFWNVTSKTCSCKKKKKKRYLLIVVDDINAVSVIDIDGPPVFIFQWGSHQQISEAVMVQIRSGCQCITKPGILGLIVTLQRTVGYKNLLLRDGKRTRGRWMSWW